MLAQPGIFCRLSAFGISVYSLSTTVALSLNMHFGIGTAKRP